MKTAKDFSKGDMVYHRSNTTLKMIIIGINFETDEVTCRWTDSSGTLNREIFFTQEIEKCDGLGPSISVIRTGRNNRF